MATSVVFPPIGGTTYSVPADGETNWATLSNYLIALASAQGTTSQKVAIRKCLTTPITVISSSDCVLNVQLTTPGAVSVVLPVSPQGQYFTVVDGAGNAATNNITVTASGGATINGSASYLITTNRASADFIYILAANNWIVRATGIVGTLPIASGGTGQITANAALNAFLPTQSGANGKVLSSDGTNSAWSTITTVIGTLPIANGGTGQITANAALNAFLPSQTSNAGKVLATDGTNSSWAAGLTTLLPSAQIFVGNGSNLAVAVAVSSEASLSNTGAMTLLNSAVIGKVLTGYVSGSGTVAATDTILQAVNKLNGNDALKSPIADPTFTGTVTGTFSGNLTGNVTGNISGTAPAGSLTGTTLASNVVTSSLTTVGALNSGSITSGFGAIDIGTDTLTAGFLVLGGNNPTILNSVSTGQLVISGGNSAATNAGGQIVFYGSGDANTGLLLIEGSNQTERAGTNNAVNFNSYSAVNTEITAGYYTGAGAWTFGPAGTVNHLFNGNIVKVLSGNTNSNLILRNSTTGDALGCILQQDGTATYLWDNSNGFLSFGTNAIDRARITSAGDFLVYSTAKETRGVTLYGTGANCFYFASTATTGYMVTNEGGGATPGAGTIMTIYNGSTARGSITVDNTGTQYVTTSDYRLKTNVAPISGALAKLALTNPVTYDWTDSGEHGQGFVAHELQAVFPDAVSGTKDALDEKGNPAYQGIDPSKLVATLVAAVRELSAKNDALEARLAALEV
jgi:hypothetical protein